MFCDHETDKNWPNSKPDSSLFRCSNHVTSRSSSFTKFQQPIGQLQKIYECPERSTGPSNYHFLSDLYTLDVSLKDKLLCGDGGEGGLGSGSCGWSIYIYIYSGKIWKKRLTVIVHLFFSHWKIYRLKGTVCCWQNMTKPSCTLQQIRPPRRHMSIKSISQMALLNTGDWISLMCKSEFPTIINPCKNLRYPGKHTSA